MTLWLSSILAATLMATTGFGRVVADDDLVTGSGKATAQTRHVAAFHRIDSLGSADIEVDASRSSGDLNISGDDNVLPLIDTRVEDGTLVVRPLGNYSSANPVKIRVASATLDALSLRGSGTVGLWGLRGGTLELRDDGSAVVSANGSVDSLDVRLGGSGSVRFGSLRARSANVRIFGSGDADVDVSGTLVAEVYGSGKISYGGNPSVKSKTYGSGTIVKR